MGFNIDRFKKKIAIVLIFLLICLTIGIGVGYKNTVIFEIMLVLSLIPFQIIYIHRQGDKKIRQILYIILFIRLTMAVYQRYFGTLPLGSEDSRGFDIASWKIALSSRAMKDIFSIRTDFHFKYIASIYYALGRVTLFIQSINVFLSIATIVFIGKITEELVEDKKLVYEGIIMATLWPLFNIFVTTIIRESIIIFFTTLSIYQFIVWTKHCKNKYIIAAILYLFIASIFHSGVVYILLIYLCSYIFYDPVNKKYKVYVSHLIISLILILLIVYKFNNILMGRLSSLNWEFILKVLSITTNGRTSYLQGLKPRSIMDLIWQTPIKMIFFMCTPFIWNIRTIGDMILFCFDVVPYYFIYYYIVRMIKNNGLRRNFAVTSLLIIGLVIFSVYSLGTLNYGTAARHRLKAIGVLIPLYAFSKKQIDINKSLI